MKIQPLQNIVYIKIDEVHAGALVTSSKASAVEFAEVIALGKHADMEKTLKVGDKIFVKSWGVDIVQYGDQKYHFVSIETNAILAIVK